MMWLRIFARNYAKDGKKVGPLLPSQLKQMVQSGQLTPNDMILKEGLANWVTVQSVKWG